MAELKPGQIRVRRQGGNSYICPEVNKAYVVRCVSDLDGIDHYKSPKPVAAKPATPPLPPAVPAKTKASLLGSLLKDNKILLPELIEWIEKCKSLEDAAIVMNGETRAGAKKAYQERITELLK